MGGNGSGRYGRRPTVEASRRLDVETLIRATQGYPRGMGQLAWGDGSAIGFQWRINSPLDAWIVLRFDRGEHKVDQRVNLCRGQPHFGGDRWWFVCPKQNWRVRMLYLPPGGSLFASRRAHRLAYASQRESATHRAMRRARTINARLGGDNTGAFPWRAPDKPKRMRWSTYGKFLQKIAASEEVVNEHLRRKLARWAR